MYTYNDTFSVTDLRHKTNVVLKAAKDKGFAYLMKRSKIDAAIVSADYLKALQEAYEDYLDTLEFDKTIKLKRIPLDVYKKKFNGK